MTRKTATLVLDDGSMFHGFSFGFDKALGLAIAKNIVDMHGGTIQVTSDLNGTVFTVRLRTNFDINRENFQMP